MNSVQLNFAKFGALCFDAVGVGELDGFQLEEFALKAGLITQVQPTERCSREECVCEENNFAFGCNLTALGVTEEHENLKGVL